MPIPFWAFYNVGVYLYNFVGRRYLRTKLRVLAENSQNNWYG